jgi:hypothetical protein
MANSQDVGKDTERMVAAYLRGRGLAGVERAVRTGFRSVNRAVADAGDLTGIPGVCVQVKSLRTRDPRHKTVDPTAGAERSVRKWLAETELQRQASGASVGLLVVRRWGTTDVGRWWCFLCVRDLFGMADGFSAQLLTVPELLAAPVRLELSDVVTMMQAWGWAPAQEGTR